jgi:hypothetical protein
MILFFSNIPVYEQNKLNKLVERAKTLYDSDFYDIEKHQWLSDKLTIESLFPSWIVKEYNENSNVLVIPIIKNYMRWLLSLEYGYGAQLDWENIRFPLFSKQQFWEAYLDFYFPGADFSQTGLKNNIKNVKKFFIKADLNYFSVKGTPQAIKYLISNLLGIPWNSVVVFTGNTNIITIQIQSLYQSDFDQYKTFLEEHVFPAGTAVVYEYF